MNQNIRSFLIVLAVLGVYAQGFATTTISSLPYTINSGGEYEISQNFSIGSGTGININADNVILAGASAGTVITYSISGPGIAIKISDGRSNVLIKNLTLHQENVYSNSKGIHGSTLKSFTADKVTINVKSGVSKAGFGFDVSGDTSSHIQHCAINISGQSRFYGIDSPTNLKIHDNTFTVNNHSNPSQYPYVIYNPRNSEIYNNRFAVNGAKVNVFGSWGGDNNIIRENIINYSSTDGGRIILINGGANNWEIYDNKITVTSNTKEAQYVLRIRGIDGKSADHNLFHHNTVDIRNASGTVYTISLGDNSPMNGNKIYSNLLKSNSSVIQFYSSNAAGTEIYCNDIQANGSAYPIYLSYRTPPGVKIYNNKLASERADGSLVYVTATATGVQICDNDIDSSDIMGGGAVSINSAVCQPNLCSGLVGSNTVLPPTNLRIVQKVKRPI